jgi:oligopeptide/dipeptide ABC transporter ATP-binding protein
MISLSIRHLDVRYPDGTWAVRDVSLEIEEGTTHALIGESGCGKTTIVRAVLGLLPPRSRCAGSVLLGSLDTLTASETEMRRIRGELAGYVPQNPFGSFNPLITIAGNVCEAWRARHLRPSEDSAKAMLGRLGIADSGTRSKQYPHTWSGGMLQRAGIAAAAALTPRLIVADEPTSALDSELAETVLESLKRTSASLFLISHDIGLVRRFTDRVSVLYAGRMVESGSAEEVLGKPVHPYTRGLLAALPTVKGVLPTPLEGAPPSLRDESPCCSFSPRCPFASGLCFTEVPAMSGGVACHKERR